MRRKYCLFVGLLQSDIKVHLNLMVPYILSTQVLDIVLFAREDPNNVVSSDKLIANVIHLMTRCLNVHSICAQRL